MQELTDILKTITEEMQKALSARTCVGDPVTVEGKTVTRHIPIAMLPAVKHMTERHRKLKTLLKELGETNWLLAKEGVELKDYGTL
jgi:hypothetical protein